MTNEGTPGNQERFDGFFMGTWAYKKKNKRKGVKVKRGPGEG